MYFTINCAKLDDHDIKEAVCVGMCMPADDMAVFKWVWAIRGGLS